jgi:hypothetical protein
MQKIQTSNPKSQHYLLRVPTDAGKAGAVGASQDIETMNRIQTINTGTKVVSQEMPPESLRMP